MTLEEIEKKYKTDKGGHGYIPLYERYIKDPKVLLEIGIDQGGSLQMWTEYFPGTRVIGVDISPGSMIKGMECILGDATDPEICRLLPDWFDVVIDDGSHKARDIIKTFDIFWPKVDVGGWYIIEDLACMFDPAYEGDANGGLVSELLHHMTAQAIKGTVKLHAYEQIVFIYKDARFFEGYHSDLEIDKLVREFDNDPYRLARELLETRDKIKENAKNRGTPFGITDARVRKW